MFFEKFFAQSDIFVARGVCELFFVRAKAVYRLKSKKITSKHLIIPKKGDIILMINSLK